jgi:hypothetical protein
MSSLPTPEEPRPDSSGREVDRDAMTDPKENPAADDRNAAAFRAGATMVLATLALVAFLAVILRPAPPVEIAEVIAAAGGLLAGVATIVRAIRGG